MGSTFRQRGRQIWMLQYYRDGRRIIESSRTTDKAEAKKLLAKREAAIADGAPLSARIGRLRFEESAADLLNDYRIHGKRSLAHVERRIRLHLRPVFGGRRMAAITTADVRAFIAARQAAGASSAEINRELAALKRMFSLAIQAGKLIHRPHIPMLREDNARQGFFDPEQLAAVLAHLPPPVRPVIEFAAITGWRIPSEVLPLEWRHVDFTAGEVRLDPTMTKTREGRVFPMTTDLRALLEAQWGEHQRLAREGRIVPWVFHRNGRRIVSFIKTWRKACRLAGCPGRIPHDLRRTAVRALVRAGVPERVAMQLTGHKTRSVFERYHIISSADLREAARRLDTVPILRTSSHQDASDR
jgi:integrase